MIKNRYLIIGAIVLLTPFIVGWIFNHINSWIAFAVAFAIILGFNQYLKNKEK